MKIPERFIWAANLMNIQPHQNILEIGCGAGLLAEQIIEELKDGRFTGVDKSVPMVVKAQKRNQQAIEAGLAEFVASDFKKAALLDSHYDAIAAFNVNFFRKDPKPELEIIKNILNPGGKLFVFYQFPLEVDFLSAEPMKDKLIDNGFDIIDTLVKKFKPSSSICIIAEH